MIIKNSGHYCHGSSRYSYYFNPYKISNIKEIKFLLPTNRHIIYNLVYLTLCDYRK